MKDYRRNVQTNENDKPKKQIKKMTEISSINFIDRQRSTNKYPPCHVMSHRPALSEAILL
jgi:hypothetical protein